MKKIALIFGILLINVTLKAQQSIKLKDLAVPNSPAFILTDITPTLIQNPNSPKKFVLGLAQSFDKSSSGFPENYAAEFAPYWLTSSEGKNVYTAVGLKTKTDDDGNFKILNKEDVFSGLKFASISLGFINKDLIPDGVDLSQKVFALGARATFIKVQQDGYAKKMKGLIDDWHIAAQKDLEAYQLAVAIDTSQENLDLQTKKLAEKNAQKSGILADEIAELIQQKPKFSWDFAGAYATYGIEDQDWQTGRVGAWTTLSTYIPLASTNGKAIKNYFNLNASLRYLRDNFSKNDLGLITKINNIDVGGKAALEFDQLSVGVETLYRYVNGKGNAENRTVGVINYKIADNIFLNGAFGKNFESQSKSIAILGINWGIGSEKANLPGN